MQQGNHSRGHNLRGGFAVFGENGDGRMTMTQPIITWYAIVEFAAGSRQVPSRYRDLCAAIPHAEDGGEIGNPTGFTFQEQQWVLPNHDHFQSTGFEIGVSLGLGITGWK